jgi:hypothetical protein
VSMGPEAEHRAREGKALKTEGLGLMETAVGLGIGRASVTRSCRAESGQRRTRKAPALPGARGRKAPVCRSAPNPAPRHRP